MNIEKTNFIFIQIIITILILFSLELDFMKNVIHNNQILKIIIAISLLSFIYIFYKKSISNMNLLKQVEKALNESCIVSKTTPDGKITFVNDKFCNISGYKGDELKGRTHSLLKNEDTPKEIFEKMKQAIESNKTFHGIIKNRTKNGNSFYIDNTIVPIFDTKGNIKEYIGIAHEVNDITNPSKQLIEDIRESKSPFLIIVRFANYNTLMDLYTHNLLIKLENVFALEVLDLLPNALIFNKVYQLGNGEFAFLKEEKYRENLVGELNLLIQKFHQNISKHVFMVNNQSFELKTLISFAIEDENIYESVKIGLKKVKYKKESIIFSNGFAKENFLIATKNLKIIGIVEKALANDKIVSYFQPIIDNKTNEVVKYESLVRIIDENGKIISPNIFIDVAKKASLYSKITIKVLENSFANLAYTDKEITINLSALDIEDIEIRNLLLTYITKSEYYGRVTFELLEDENLNDYELVKDFISLAKILGGVKIAIDDFGSGYSNYERLIGFQPDILKIDASLIKNITTNKTSQNIVDSIVSFAKSENIKTVAEFVKDKDIFEYVKSIGIDYSQGFYFGKPIPLEERID